MILPSPDNLPGTPERQFEPQHVAACSAPTCGEQKVPPENKADSWAEFSTDDENVIRRCVFSSSKQRTNAPRKSNTGSCHSPAQQFRNRIAQATKRLWNRPLLSRSVVWVRRSLSVGDED
uniref:Uncharacterized protein n=1 Tax=Anguilla anguilla TaxID=7936 RepID=A0A0E9XD81_ANGAN